MILSVSFSKPVKNIAELLDRPYRKIRVWRRPDAGLTRSAAGAAQSAAGGGASRLRCRVLYADAVLPQELHGGRTDGIFAGACGQELPRRCGADGGRGDYNPCKPARRNQAAFPPPAESRPAFVCIVGRPEKAVYTGRRSSGSLPCPTRRHDKRRENRRAKA